MQVVDNIKSMYFIKKIRKVKGKRYALRNMLSAKTVGQLEKHPEQIETKIAEHLNNFPILKKALYKEINKAFIQSEIINENSIDKEKLKLDIIYCYIAYGYSVNEYLCYGFVDKTQKERREFISDRESVCLGLKLNDVDAMMIFSDKMKTYEKFKNYYRREAISICSVNDYSIFDEFCNRHHRFVKKNVKESCVRSVEMIDIEELKKTTRSLFDNFLAEGKTILEEIVSQNTRIGAFNSSSVNTIRCITLNINGKIKIPYCFLKVGRKGSFIDNGASGGILVGINCDSGKLETLGVDEYGHRYLQHPDSGIVFQGFQIPDWNEMLKMCREMSKQIPKVRLIGWDLAYTDYGWVLIEGNSLTELIGPQGTWQRGIRNEIEILIKS